MVRGEYGERRPVAGSTRGAGIVFPLLLVLLVVVAAATGLDAHAAVAAIASTLP